MAQVDVYTAIYDKLTADQTGGSFYDDLANSTAKGSGKSIWSIQAPQDESLPLCIITPVSDLPDRYFGDSDLDATFQIDLYADAESSTPEALLSTNQKLIDLLDRQTITTTNHTHVVVLATDRGVVSREEDAYRIISEWSINGTSS